MPTLTDPRRQGLAAVWFGLAAALPLAKNPVFDGAALMATLPGFLVLGVLPCVLGAAAGYWFGAALLAPPAACGARWATVRGIGIALLAHVAYVPLVSLCYLAAMAYGARLALGEVIAAAFGVLMLMMATSVSLGWLIILVGAAAGLSLFLLRGWLGAPPT